LGAQVVKCPACGAVLTGEGSSCSYCGAKLIVHGGETDSAKGISEKELIDLLKAGNFLQAIKQYKDSSGKGLKESKEYVEALAQKNGIEVKKGCFVATACYGDYNAPEVKALRRFRDERLAATCRGRTFIRLYYAVSPSLANCIAGSPLLKRAVRTLLLDAVVKRLPEKYRAD
jgi:DNA-directed RNA polymerase subunit RPC12/RpoP